MIREGMTIREATEQWVSTMNRVPLKMIQDAVDGKEWEFEEITRIARGDRVYFSFGIDVNGEQYEGYGRVNKILKEKVQIMTDDEVLVLAEKGYVENSDRDTWPMWGWLWNPDESIDEEWIEENAQTVSDLGFRIWSHEDYGVFLGIDGAGYNFYDEHWIPLYKARGLQWHDKEMEVTKNA